ncbi:hypothetical protein [Caldimonas brevitalea]|uniref:Uncharacterized protein n=1 Tax=Caldimonas brevitalea TaxID=413882 RepID=A0A0G3BLG9_9BURK|nr:hypothetical protein [Caldimonas brevitalea]AKJ28813.1 hypothetical protein AAW51_2122 [Caldimonas brevitalea]
MTPEQVKEAHRVADELDLWADQLHSFMATASRCRARTAATLLRTLAAAAQRLAKAERSLRLSGYTDEGGELWKPPLGPLPKWLRAEQEPHDFEMWWSEHAADKTQREAWAAYTAARDGATEVSPVAEDGFRGDTTHLVNCIDALLKLDAKGVLVPHGIGGHARQLLAAASSRLAAALPPAAQQGEPVGEVFTMEALHPSGHVRSHAALRKALPAGTLLYTCPPAEPGEDLAEWKRRALDAEARARDYANRIVAIGHLFLESEECAAPCEIGRGLGVDDGAGQ